MNEKILVAYASQTGFTAGVAEAIAGVMKENGAQVDVRRMKDIDDVTPYRAVVAGSAIQGCAWLPEAMHFVQTQRAALKQRPFAAFLVCMTLMMENGKYSEDVKTWLNPVNELVPLVSKGFFSGALDSSKISSISDKIKFRLSVLFGVWKEGDYRDWDAIRAWAKDTYPLLIQPSPATPPSSSQS